MITIRMDKYCVYTHSIDGDVFYVGKGLSGRPFDAHSRNPEWLAIAAGAGSFDVEIVGWYDSGEAALEAEAQLIKKLKPIANGGRVRGVSTKSLVNRVNKYLPCTRNIARLTDWGRIQDKDRFKASLRKHLGIPKEDQTWTVSKEWEDAYNDYFFYPDLEYVKSSDRPARTTEKKEKWAVDSPYAVDI